MFKIEIIQETIAAKVRSSINHKHELLNYIVALTLNYMMQKALNLYLEVNLCNF